MGGAIIVRRLQRDDDEEIRRRTRAARLFPNEASCLRLVTAVVMEIAEDWQTADKRYLSLED